MSEAYWNRVASEAKPETKAVDSGKNWLAIYTDARVGRLLIDAITPYSSRKGGYLLDVGCGPAKWAGLFAHIFPQLTIVGIDLSKQMLELARLRSDKKNIQLANMNAAELALPDNRFDIAASVTVLQHISDDEIWRNALKEIVRVTKPEGHIVIFDAFLSIGQYKVRKLHEYISSLRLAGARLVSWEGADPSYPIKAMELIEYGRSFNQEKVYYFDTLPKFSSMFSRALANVSCALDAHLGKTTIGMLAPHKVLVFEKSARNVTA